MEPIYQADNQYFEFFKEQVKELQLERSQCIITSVFQALTGSRHKTRRRQVTGIPPPPVTTGTATPVTVADFQATTMPPLHVENASEPLMPVPIAEVPMQLPIVDSQLRGSNITNVQVHHNGSNISVCSLDLEAHET